MSDLGDQNPFAPPRAALDAAPATQPGQLVLADRGARFGAYILDMLPFVAIAFVFSLLLPLAMGLGFGQTAQGDFTALGILFVLGAGVVTLAYGLWVLVLIHRYGQTMGKRVLGIRVVRADGSRVSLPRYFFLRYLLLGVLAGIPFVGFLIAVVDALLIFRDSRQCLHDNIADTIVVTAASSQHATLEATRQAGLA